MIWLRSSSSEYWSRRFGNSAVNALTFFTQPVGMSSATPPTWK